MPCWGASQNLKTVREERVCPTALYCCPPRAEDKPWQNRLHNHPRISCCIRRWMKNPLSPTTANLISLTLRCPMEVGWFHFLGSLNENKTHSTLLSNKAWESPFYGSKAAKLPDQGVDFRTQPCFETEPIVKMEFCQKSHKEKFCFI